MVVGSGCDVCGVHGCVSHPEIDYLDTYPFLPGGRTKVPGREGFEWVPAPYPMPSLTIPDVIEYGLGDRVPMRIAVVRGISQGPPTEHPKLAPRGRRI